MLHGLNSKSLVVLGFGALSLTSFAQVSSFRESTFNPNQVSVEAKPLPMILSAIPGVAGVGLGTELSAGGNVTTFADIYGLYANLPGNLRGEGREQDIPVVQKMSGYSVDIGGRYYTDHSSWSSWYGGARLSYGVAVGQWGYQGEQIDQTVRAFSPGLEGGHRWVLRNNILIRLGAGLDGNIVQENRASAKENETQVTSDAEDKVKGYAKVAVTPRVDLGLGYVF